MDFLEPACNRQRVLQVALEALQPLALVGNVELPPTNPALRLVHYALYARIRTQVFGAHNVLLGHRVIAIQVTPVKPPPCAPLALLEHTNQAAAVPRARHALPVRHALLVLAHHVPATQVHIRPPVLARYALPVLPRPVAAQHLLHVIAVPDFTARMAVRARHVRQTPARHVAVYARH